MGRILLLGGTGWLGKVLSAKALERGHQVTALARGTSAFHPGVHAVVADRESPCAYRQVQDTSWDLVIELTDTPKFAREAVDGLGAAARNWVLVSSCSVYKLQSVPGADETAGLVAPLAETADVLNADFGRAKSSCEVVSMRGRKREVLVVRPGLVGGPGDPSGRSTYWPLRFAERRNPVLVPLAPDGESHVQVIDVRDLAIFILEAGMAGNHGYVNAVGKVHTLGHALLLAAEAAEHGPATQGSRAHAHQMFGYDLTLMERDQVNPWAGPRSLPLVLPPGGRYAGFARRSDARALGMGLQRRSLLQSFEDIVHAHGGAGVDALRSGISATAEAALVNELKMRPPTWGGLEEDW